jgi:hypothetical protein
MEREFDAAGPHPDAACLFAGGRKALTWHDRHEKVTTWDLFAGGAVVWNPEWCGCAHLAWGRVFQLEVERGKSQKNRVRRHPPGDRFCVSG